LAASGAPGIVEHRRGGGVYLAATGLCLGFLAGALGKARIMHYIVRSFADIRAASSGVRAALPAPKTPFPAGRGNARRSGTRSASQDTRRWRAAANGRAAGAAETNLWRRN